MHVGRCGWMGAAKERGWVGGWVITSGRLIVSSSSNSLALARSPLTSGSTRWSYTTRFNALNAILVDLLLILPKMAASLFPPASAVAAQLWGYLFNTLFGLVLVAAVVGVYKSLVNEEVRLPFLEDAVRAQMSY